MQDLQCRGEGVLACDESLRWELKNGCVQFCVLIVGEREREGDLCWEGKVIVTEILLWNVV